MAHVIAPSLLAFLEGHLNKLRQNNFFDGRGRVEGFAGEPSHVRGSMTITEGIKIEAVAKFIQHFSLFNKDYYGDDAQFYFTYQIRISGPKSADAPKDFSRCQLTKRYW